jgi:hypothetical protein
MLTFYIDPGTGSMLFSIIIGVAATLYFSCRSLFLKMKMGFASKEERKQKMEGVPYVIYCEGPQYINVFHPIVLEFEKRGIPLVYYTSAEKDPALTEKFAHVKAEFIGTGNKAFAKLNFLNADVVLMTTPGLDVYQLKRSKDVRHYAHILHATSDATGYRLFGIDFYDSVLLTGDYQKEDLRYLEKERGLKPKELVTVGCTYLDVLEEKKEQMKPVAGEHLFTVLVSPSWGPSALLSQFGEKLLDPLSKTGMQVIVRPHPQSSISEKEMLDALQERYASCPTFSWDYEKDNSSSLSKADIMISDFSGIIFDYTFLYDKPVLYVDQGFDKTPYDADDVPREMWQFRSLKEFGIPLRSEDFDRIGEILRSTADDPHLKQMRQKAKDEAWAHQGHAAEQVFDYLSSVEKKLHEKEVC